MINENLKTRFWLLTGMTSATYMEVISELDKIEFGEGLVELWVKDLEDKQKEIDRLNMTSTWWE
jgi:hypothetical protein